MSYYFHKTIHGTFDDAVEKITAELAKDGFGVLTEVDVQATLKKKLDVDFRKYKILGACNPNFANEALKIESRIGTMLPCNVVVQELDENQVEIAVIDPVASMKAVENDELNDVALQVQNHLRNVIARVC